MIKQEYRQITSIDFPTLLPPQEQITKQVQL